MTREITGSDISIELSQHTKTHNYMLRAFSFLSLGHPQWLWYPALAAAHHLERDGSHLSRVKNIENKPICQCRLITDSNVSAEGALSVAWEHHLPVSNVLYIISPPPHVSSLLRSWCSTVMKIARKWGNWEPASRLSSNNQSPTPNTEVPPKRWLSCHVFYVWLVDFHLPWLTSVHAWCSVCK